MRTDVDACDCRRGLYGHSNGGCTERLLGGKSHAALENRTRVSIVSMGIGPTIYQLSFFSVALRPQRPYELLGWGAQDVHLDFHTAPEL